WALGVTLCEALSRQQPSGLHDPAGSFSLPPELSPGFMELIARCLSRSPADRPTIAGVEAWMRTGEIPAAPPAPVVVPEEIPTVPARSMPERPALEVASPSAHDAAPRPATSQPVQALASRIARSAELVNQLPLSPRTLLILGAVVVFLLSWAGLRALKSP